MRGHAAPVDETQAMTHTLQYSPHDQLVELLATATGRFGRRRVRTIALPDPEMAPARTTTVVLMRERIENGEHQIDSLHVADAIVDRLCAGGLTTPLHQQSA
jgi:hypothetical protein